MPDAVRNDGSTERARLPRTRSKAVYGNQWSAPASNRCYFTAIPC